MFRRNNVIFFLEITSSITSNFANKHHLFSAKIAVYRKESNSIVILLVWQWRGNGLVVFASKFPYLGFGFAKWRLDKYINDFISGTFMYILDRLLRKTYPELVYPPTIIVWWPTEMEPWYSRPCVRSPSFLHWPFLNSAIVGTKYESCDLLLNFPPMMYAASSVAAVEYLETWLNVILKINPVWPYKRIISVIYSRCKREIWPIWPSKGFHIHQFCLGTRAFITFKGMS